MQKTDLLSLYISLGKPSAGLTVTLSSITEGREESVNIQEL